MQRAFLRLISALALTWACFSPAPLASQTAADNAANTAWQLDAMIHMQRMRAFHDTDTGTQPTPSAIPELRWMPIQVGSFQRINQAEPR
jgi:hypothetical protein